MTPAEPTRPEESAADEDEPPDSRPSRARRTLMLAGALPAFLLPVAAAPPPAAEAPLTPTVSRIVDPQEISLMRMRALPPSPPPPTHLAWPGDDPVTSEFGYRWGRPHNGIDIDGHTGDPVTAAADGVVVEADYEGGYGLQVIIRHSTPFAGLTTSYAHLSASVVAVGEGVERGQRIGDLGATGNAVGDHLHFEVRRGDEPLNPRHHLDPVREGAQTRR